MTRSRLIQGWFLMVAVAAALGVTFGGVPSLMNSVVLLALSLMPPAIVLYLMPGVQPATIAEVLHGVDRRR